MASLPASAAYPELARRACDILEGWYHRFPLSVWSRFVKFADSGTGRKQQIPKVLKEFNESAPVLARLMEWVHEFEQAGAPPVAILDLCSGFGFLAMFAAELLPPAQVEKIYLIDKVWPNRNVPGSTGGGITTAHIYGHGEWPIPLLTLQIDVTRGREVRDLGRHILQDPCPTILCGIHLCGTLSLRAIQMFNDGLRSGCGVVGLILAPCCLPRKEHRSRKFCYQVGSYRFSAEDLYDRKGNDGRKAHEVYMRHLMQCIVSPEKSREEMGSKAEVNFLPKVVDNASGDKDADAQHVQRYTDKNVFFFAKAPFRHAGEAAGEGADFGLPVVVEGNHLPHLVKRADPVEAMH